MIKNKNKKDPLICPRYWLSDFVRIDGGLKVLLFLRPIMHFEEGATHKVKGRVIVTCNHNSWVEAPTMMRIFLRRRIHFLAAKILIKGKKTEWFYKRMNCIIIDRHSKDFAALRTAIRALNKERLLVIFPEGKLSEDGTNSDFKNGAALLALQTKTPILPLYIQENKSGGRRTYVCVGNLIDPNIVGDGSKSKENQQLITDMIQNKTFEMKRKLNEKIEECKKENKKMSRAL